MCNSLEWVDWATNPVQVLLCESCGFHDCGSGGYVHVSYLDGLVLWTAPQIDTSDEWAVGQYAAAPALRRWGALAIPKATWDEWRAVAPELPDVSTFSAPNGVAVADAWSLGPGRPTRLDELVPMLRARLLACDTLDTGDAIDRIQRWMGRLTASTGTIHGALRPPEEIGARVEKLYFDGPAAEDWPALALGDNADFPLFDLEHAFVPTIRDA